MYKLLFMFKRKPELTFDEFVDYYENHHVKIGYKFIKNPIYYSRKFLRPLAYPVSDGATTPQDTPYDVVMELGFASEADFITSTARLTAEDFAEIAADEARFMDRTRQSMFTVDERVSPIALFATEQATR